MTKQEEVQIKVIALQVTQGDIMKAKDVFNWLIEDTLEAEVVRRKEQQVRNQIQRAEIATQQELFDGQ